MSAELWREAADAMRMRAVRGTLAEPWTAKVLADGRAWVHGANDYALSMHGYREDAEHIASWHPGVALAVASWLAGLASRFSHDASGSEMDAADLIAHAYLGGDQ